MAAYTFSIGGSNREVILESLSIAETANGVDTLTCTVRSLAGTYRPAIDDDFIVSENGTAIFGGLVESVLEMGANEQGNTVGIRLSVTAKSYDIYAQRRLITVTLAAGSLESQLNTLISEFTTYGTAMHASQATGPTNPAVSFVKTRGDEVLNELAALATGNDTAGWTWAIDENNKLRMIKSNEIAAPFNVVNADGNAKGDIEVETTRNDLYANRIYVVVESGPATSTETFVAADGVTSGGFIYFTAKYPASSNIGDVYPNILLIDSVASGVIGFGSTQLPADNWYWDYTNHRLVYTIGSPYDFPTGSEVLSITYAIAYPITAQADDAAGQAAYGLWERTVVPPNVLTLAAAQDYADGLIAAMSPTKQTVRYVTDELGIKPGMYQTVNVTKRNINTTVLVQEVNTRSLTSTLVHREVVATTADTFQGSFRATLDQWMKSGGASTGSASGSPTGGVASPPLKSIQYNNAGAFGGSSKLTYRSGTTYGGYQGMLEVESESDDSVWTQILKSADGKYLGIQVYQGGTVYFILDAGDMIFQCPGNFEMSPSGHIIATCATQYTDQIKLRGLTSVYGLAGLATRTTSTSYTFDSAGSPLTTLFADATSAAITVNLPAISNGAITTTVGTRICAIKNIGTANNVTIDPNASETIDGATTLVLAPSEGVIIQAWNGTGSGWYILARI